MIIWLLTRTIAIIHNTGQIFVYEHECIAHERVEHA
jgi:hypothetical protein